MNYFNEGVLLYSSADYAGEVRAFKESSRFNPYSASTKYLIGYAKYGISEFTNAQEAFSRAYELDPDFTPPSCGAGH